MRSAGCIAAIGMALGSGPKLFVAFGTAALGLVVIVAIREDASRPQPLRGTPNLLPTATVTRKSARV